MEDSAPHAIACGFENPPGAQFCGSCGQPLAVTCGRCGTEVSAGFSFCTSCGNPLAGLQSHHPRPADLAAGAPADESAHRQITEVASDSVASDSVASERRLVSVLFCDLEDSTGLAESLDPEEVRDILSHYFRTAREIVARHGGTIEKFIGDAVVGVWGTPVAREDDAERAVRAALEIVAEVARMEDPALPRPLAARAAVATGESAVILGQQDQGMVAGDIMNMAARLQSVAESGSVLMNDATRRATNSSIKARSAGTQRLKGRLAPVHTWRALQPNVIVGRAEADEPRLVGRRAELDELIRIFDSVKRSGRGRLVSMVGVAGIGKSRLVNELERRLRKRHGSVAWYLSRTPWQGAGTAFAPLAELARHVLGIDDGIGPGADNERMEAALVGLVADDRERDWIKPRLAVLLDPDTEGEYAREELFAAWARLFNIRAQGKPIVAVLEDAQRADPALLEFVEYLANVAHDRQVMVLTLARPELLELRPGWGAGLRNFSTLHLGRMSNAEITLMLTRLAPGLSKTLVSGVVRRADGVPLYAVEIARMLQDRRAATQRSAGDEILPASLHALIAARLDGLGDAERSLVMSAAVLGRRFTGAALAAVADADPAEISQSVDLLLRQEILARGGDTRLGGVGDLAFQEQLVQDVAYRTLARAERRRRHVRAAEYLEGLGDEELVEQVADHLLKAWQADRSHSQAAAIADRARPALIRAARRARALHAPERALVHLEHALSMAVEDSERASTLEEAAAAAQAAGSFAVAERHLRELQLLRRNLKDQPGAALASARLAGLYLVTQRYDAAFAEVETALVRLDQHGSDNAAGVELAGQLARAHLLRGDLSKAADWAAQALESANRLDLPAVATDALITRGAARVQMGEHGRGIKDLDEAIARCSANDMLGLELRARNNVAWALAADDPRRTVEAARAGFELGRQRGLRDWAIQLASVAVGAAIDTGDWDWALATIRDLEDEPMSAAHRIDIAATDTILRSLRGIPNPAAPLKRAGPLPDDINPQIRALAEHAQAWEAFVRGHFSRAATLAARAASAAIDLNRHTALVLAARSAMWARDADGLASLLDELRADPVLGRSTTTSLHTLEAGASALAGGPEARAAYRKAIAGWRKLDLPLPLLLAISERDSLIGPTPDSARTVQALMDRLQAKGLERLLRGTLA